MAEALGIVLAFLVFLVFIWLVYCNITIIVVFIINRKKDKSLELCLTTKGKIFYLILLVLFFIEIIFGSYLTIQFLMSNKQNLGYLILNAMTILTFVITYFFQEIVLTGKRDIMVGRLTLDKRKIKRIQYIKRNVQFIYGQKNYKINLRFIDVQKLKINLQKSR